MLAAAVGGGGARAAAWEPGGAGALFATTLPPLLGCAALHGAAACPALVDALAAALEAVAEAPPADEASARFKVRPPLLADRPSCKTIMRWQLLQLEPRCRRRS